MLGTRVEFVLPRYTSKLQVLDVGINKPFKNNVDTAYETWLISNQNTKVHRKDIARFIDNAWQSIPNECVENTWEHIGLLDNHF